MATDVLARPATTTPAPVGPSPRAAIGWLAGGAVAMFAASLIGSDGAGRPLLGLRKKPGRLALTFMHMPLRAYAHDHGHLLGHTFLQFTHSGRTSGKEYRSVAMVLGHDQGTDEAVICAAWDTDWYRNLQAHPATNVKIDRLSFTPVQRFLDDEEALRVLLGFRGAHPYRVRLISRILGWGDLDDDETVREFIRTHPFVAFRPQPTT